jgi:ankyrin repeat protein/L-ascorbate metabolism protein UlaG (beta-lactamase superfamily)
MVLGVKRFKGKMKKILFLFFMTSLFLVTPVYLKDIHQAARHGDLEKLKILLENNPELVNAQDGRGCTPLHYAAGSGYTAVTVLLLEKGADIKSRDRNGDTPLHYAAKGGQKDMIELFLSKGVNVNITDNHGRTPLHHAVSWEHKASVKHLLEKGADIKAQDQWGTFPIHYAAFATDKEIVDLLVAKGAKIDVINNDGATPMHYAVRVGSLNILERAFQEAMDVNAVDSFGKTPLNWAAADGQLDSVKFLLDRAENVKFADPLSRNPFHMASYRGHLPILECLIGRRMDLHKTDGHGRTPLYWAIWGGREKAAKILLAGGAKIDTPDREGKTPLHMAVVKGNTKLVNLLLDKQAEINSRDKAGRSALDLARQYMHSKLMLLLKLQGAEAYVYKKDFDISPGLEDSLQKGEAVVWYLGHSGWAVKTKSHLLVFDYSERAAPVSEPRLANGYIDPSEIQDHNVIVFVSHQHSDHFDRKIFEWQEKVKNITYVFGWKAADNPDYVYLVGPRGKIKIGDVEVFTINDHHDGVPEVAYLVKADEVVIYHSGDYVGRLDSFRNDIDYFAGKCDRVDLLFTFLVGNTSKYAIKRLKPVYAFPMHSFGRDYLYQGAALKLGKANPRTEMVCGEFQGDRYVYKKRKISR